MELIDLVAVGPPVLRLSATVAPFSVRALDAIHIATALALGNRVETFVSYDRRQLAAARRAGLATASPGVGA
jgi:predicted nucleic acid-binding protein